MSRYASQRWVDGRTWRDQLLPEAQAGEEALTASLTDENSISSEKVSRALPDVDLASLGGEQLWQSTCWSFEGVGRTSSLGESLRCLLRTRGVIGRNSRPRALASSAFGRSSCPSLSSSVLAPPSSLPVGGSQESKTSSLSSLHCSSPVALHPSTKHSVVNRPPPISRPLSVLALQKARPSLRPFSSTLARRTGRPSGFSAAAGPELALTSSSPTAQTKARLLSSRGALADVSSREADKRREPSPSSSLMPCSLLADLQTRPQAYSFPLSTLSTSRLLLSRPIVQLLQQLEKPPTRSTLNLRLPDFAIRLLGPAHFDSLTIHHERTVSRRFACSS